MNDYRPFNDGAFSQAHELDQLSRRMALLEGQTARQQRIEMIEMLDTSDRNEMTKREQHYIDLLKPNMNTISAIPKKDMICFYTTKNGKKYGPYYKSAQQNSDAKKKHYQNNPEKLKKHYKNCKENQKKVRERIRVKLT